MIEETATVVAVEGPNVLLQTQRQSTCQSCSVKTGCGTSVVSQVVGQRSSQLTVENTLELKVGDEVVIGLLENSLVKGSLLIYALPVLLMLGSGLLGDALAQSYHYNRDLLGSGFALSGFVLSLPLVRWLINRTALKQQMQPHLIRKIHTLVGARDTMLAP
ncbi:MAG: SoxR reducing system RseC family protein [Gammaproteobacteria bacterium]|nr:SoxR reducing system RseC family protein [Gammaproteobacteria bacterium]